MEVVEGRRRKLRSKVCTHRRKRGIESTLFYLEQTRCRRPLSSFEYLLGVLPEKEAVTEGDKKSRFRTLVSHNERIDEDPTCKVLRDALEKGGFNYSHSLLSSNSFTLLSLIIYVFLSLSLSFLTYSFLLFFFILFFFHKRMVKRASQFSRTLIIISSSLN